MMNTPSAALKPARSYLQVDVFTDQPFLGNALGVVLNAEGLTTAQMQQFTDWTHLSEVAFLLPPSAEHANTADYRVRIFCSGRELPFAGHPTLGSCFAWLACGGKPNGEQVIQECGVGLVPVQQSHGRLAFAAPPLLRSGPLDDDELARITKGLGLSPADVLRSTWCHNGPPWRGLMLRDAQAVLDLQPRADLLQGLEVGVVGAYPAGAPCAFEVRAFFPGLMGITEDPVTGSLNAALAQWLIGTGLAPQRYLVSQGTKLGRQGRVWVQKSGDTVWIGGNSVVCISGEVKL